MHSVHRCECTSEFLCRGVAVVSALPCGCGPSAGPSGDSKRPTPGKGVQTHTASFEAFRNNGSAAGRSQPSGVRGPALQRSLAAMRRLPWQHDGHGGKKHSRGTPRKSPSKRQPPGGCRIPPGETKVSTVRAIDRTVASFLPIARHLRETRPRPLALPLVFSPSSWPLSQILVSTSPIAFGVSHSTFARSLADRRVNRDSATSTDRT